MISDRNSRRSKGIAYVEFLEATSVPLAIGLTGQRLLGVPIIVQASQVSCGCVWGISDRTRLGEGVWQEHIYGVCVSNVPSGLYTYGLHLCITS